MNGKQFLTTEQNKKMTEIILNLMERTMEVGATYEQAQQHAFNKLEEQSPEVLAAWIQDNLN